MWLSPKFFYNSDGGEGGGKEQSTETTTTETTTTATTEEAAKEVITPSEDKGSPNKPEVSDEIKQQLLELEELRKYKAEKEKPTPSEEEKRKEAELDRVEMRKYAIKNDLAKDEDFAKYETLQQKNDTELVKENFITEFKADNKEDFDNEDELEQAAKDAFEEQYHLNSQNKTLKKQGQKLLEKEAAEIRNPYATKISTAQSKYNTEKELAKTYSEKYIPFTDSVKKAFGENITYAKMKAGEDELPIEVKLTKEDWDAAEEKFFKSPKTFYDFTEGKLNDGKLVSKLSSFFMERHRDEANQKIAETFEGIGVKKGSNVGADNPFALKQGGAVVQMSTETLEESNARIAKLRAQTAN